MQRSKTRSSVDEIVARIAPSLEQLEALWSEIAYHDSDMAERREEMLAHFEKLARYMVEEEQLTKSELVDDINLHTEKIVHLARGLGVDPITPSGLPLTPLWEAVQRRSDELEEMKNHRLAKLVVLTDKESVLCAKLGEPAVPSLKAGDVPSNNLFIEVERNICKLEQLLSERQAEFVAIRPLIRKLLQELELDSRSAAQDQKLYTAVVSDDEARKIILSAENLRTLSHWKDSLTKEHAAGKAKTESLREQIKSLSQRLKKSSSVTASLLMTGCKNVGVPTITALTANLANLNAEKFRSLPAVIQSTRLELKSWFDKCWLSKSEIDQHEFVFTSTDYTDHLLTELESELERYRQFFNDNSAVFELAERWLALWNRHVEMEERSADPKRFNNRGGTLLQEEKERKEISAALPRRSQELIQTVEDHTTKTGQVLTFFGWDAATMIAKKVEEYETDKMKRREAVRLAGTTATGTTGGTTLLSTTKKMPPRTVGKATPTMKSALRRAQVAGVGASTPNLTRTGLKPMTPLASSSVKNLHQIGLGGGEADVTQTRKRNDSGSQSGYASRDEVSSVMLTQQSFSAVTVLTSLWSGSGGHSSPVKRRCVVEDAPVVASKASKLPVHQAATKLTKPAQPQKTNFVRPVKPIPSGGAKQPAKAFPFGTNALITVEEAQNSGQWNFSIIEPVKGSKHGQNHSGRSQLDPDSGVLAGHSENADVSLASVAGSGPLPPVLSSTLLIAPAMPVYTTRAAAKQNGRK